MSIKLKDTILDYIDKAYKDSSGNVISSTYLPLSGGTLTGNLTVGSSDNNEWMPIDFNRGGYKGFIGVGSNQLEIGSLDGYIRISPTNLTYLTNNSVKTIWHSGNFTPSDYLPLSGGTITNTLTIQRTPSVIRFTSSSGSLLGFIGFGDANTPIMFKNDGATSYTLIHSGNIGSQSVDNANKLGGYDSTDFVRSYGTVGANYARGNWLGFTYATTEHGGKVSGGIISAGTSQYGFQLNGDDDADNIYFRSYSPTSFTEWRTLIHSSNIGNQSVASAAKLTTARSIWGQSFDGTRDIVGTLTSNTTKSNYIVNYTTYYAGGQFYANDISDGEEIGVYVGKSYAAKKVAYMSYHQGENDNETYATFGLHSVDNAIVIKTSGNVGIGTTSPNYKLDVSGSSNATTLYQNGKTLDNYYLPLSGGAVTNNLTVSKSASKDSTITPTTCILNIGTRTSGHSGYHTGIGFNALYYGTYSQHIHAWIGLGTYTTTATAECYPLVFATNESTTTNTAPIERMKIAPDGAVSINNSLTVGGYTVITSGNIGSQSVNYASSAGSVAWSNVSGKPSTFTPSSHTHDYLPLSGGEMTGSISHTLEPSGGRILYGKNRNSGIKYDYNGNECLMISTGTYAKASIAMYTYNRISLNDSNGQWNVSSPDMHIKNGCVAINKLIADGTNLSYNLDVNGSFNATTGYIGGSAIIHSGNIGSQSVNYSSSTGSVAWSNVSGKPSTFTPSSHTHPEYIATTESVGTFSSVQHSDYNNNQGKLITRSFMSYWNGAYNSGGSSNLAYCDRGRFGTIVTKSTGDYAAASHTHSNYASSSHTHDYLPLSGGTMTGTIITPGNDTIVIKPAKNNYDQIGGEGIVFWKIFATNFYGTLQGNCTGSSGSVNGHSFETVTSLPSSPNSGTVYFVTG